MPLRTDLLTLHGRSYRAAWGNKGFLFRDKTLG